MPAQPAEPPADLALGSQLNNHWVTKETVLLHAGFGSPKWLLFRVLSVSRQCIFTGDCNCSSKGSGDVSGLLNCSVNTVYGRNNASMLELQMFLSEIFGYCMEWKKYLAL